MFTTRTSAKFTIDIHNEAEVRNFNETDPILTYYIGSQRSKVWIQISYTPVSFFFVCTKLPSSFSHTCFLWAFTVSLFPFDQLQRATLLRKQHSTTLCLPTPHTPPLPAFRRRRANPLGCPLYHFTNEQMVSGGVLTLSHAQPVPHLLGAPPFSPLPDKIRFDDNLLSLLHQSSQYFGRVRPFLFISILSPLASLAHEYIRRSMSLSPFHILSPFTSLVTTFYSALSCVEYGATFYL